MVLTSPGFADGATLPFECAYESENRSPALSWSDAPYGVKSFAILCQDPDGPSGRPWIHWLAWNLPGNETRLAAGLPPYPRLENGMEQGLNDYLEFGWGGPCPPVGVHEYLFTLYALDSTIRPARPDSEVVIEEIHAHAFEMARLTALYDSDGLKPALAAIGLESRAAYRRSA